MPTLFRFLANAQEPHGGILARHDALRVGRAEARKLDELLPEAFAAVKNAARRMTERKATFTVVEQRGSVVSASQLLPRVAEVTALCSWLLPPSAACTVTE